MFNQGTTEIHLTATDCLESGELGLIINGLDVEDSPFVTFSGRMVAHDLIEHVNGIDSIGTVTDELQALGSVWYTRGENGIITDDGLVGDLLSLVRESMYQGIGPIIPTQPESDYDDTFQWVIESFMSKVGNELDDDDMEMVNLDQFCDQALQGLRLGAEKQAERFETPWQAYEVFLAVQDALNNHFGITETYRAGGRNTFTPEFEGMEYILTIKKDDEGLQVSFCEDYPEWDDE